MIHGYEKEEEEDLSVFVTEVYKNAGFFACADIIYIYRMGKGA